MICHQRSVAIALSAFFGVSAGADSIESLASEVEDLDQQARRLDSVVAQSPKVEEVSAEHRLVDAQALAHMGDHSRAAVLLFDIVEKYPQSRVYGEALFFLGECLYQLQDFRLARQYFTKAAERPTEPTYQKALQRLVELALRTGDYTGVDELLAKLASIPAGQLEPSVPYVRAKYLYFRGQLDEALSAFSTVQPGNPYYSHALYFAGVCQVKKQNPTEAAKIFERVLETVAATDAEKRIHELSQLALGRIHHDRGEFGEAIDRYQQVSRTSDLFDSALYEIGWVYVKAGEFQKALRAFDLLLLAKPDSALAPEVEVLGGNLLIRLNDFSKATEVFSRSRDYYDPVWRDLDTKMRAHGDSAAYLDVITGRSLEHVDVAIVFPRLAVAWVSERPDINSVVGLVARLHEMQETLKENETLLGRLDRGITGPARARVFPDLAAGRARATEIENRLVLMRDRLAQVQREIVGATGEEKQQLDALAAERKALEDQIRKLPSSAEGFERRNEGIQSEIDDVAGQAAELSVLIASMRAQLVAAEKYLADAKTLKTPEETAAFQKQANEVRSLIDDLEQEERAIREGIEEARGSVGIGDAVSQEEDEAKRKYDQALQREREYLNQLASRLGSADRERLRRADEVVERAVAVQAVISDFNRRLDAKIDERLGQVRTAVEDEKTSHVEHAASFQQHEVESREVGGGVAEGGFQAVLHRFYDVVVQSDLGIIDVAWALKQEKTDSLSRLVRDQKHELRGLDSEFQEVLEETQ